MVLSTHVLSEVQHTCSRLLVIHLGKIAADGPVELLTQQAHGAALVTVEASGSGIEDVVAAIDGVREVTAVEHREGRLALTVAAEASRDVRPALFEAAKTHGWTLYELHQETRSLEDLFQQLTSGT